MATRKRIDNIHEASATVLAFAPQDVALRDKSKVHVGRFRYVHFIPLWNMVQGMAADVLGAVGPEGVDMGTLLAGRLQEAPELALRLAAYATEPDLLNSEDPDEPQTLTDYINAIQTKWDYLDIFRVATMAINVNFGNGEARELLGFFTAATSAFTGAAEDRKAATHPTQPTKRANLQKLNLLVPPPAMDGAQA